MRMAEFKAFGNVASPMSDRARFYEVFRDDFSGMDLIYCSLPITACAYFMPFVVRLWFTLWSNLAPISGTPSRYRI